MNARRAAPSLAVVLAVAGCSPPIAESRFQRLRDEGRLGGMTVSAVEGPAKPFEAFHDERIDGRFAQFFLHGSPPWVRVVLRPDHPEARAIEAFFDPTRDDDAGRPLEGVLWEPKLPAAARPDAREQAAALGLEPGKPIGHSPEWGWLYATNRHGVLLVVDGARGVTGVLVVALPDEFTKHWMKLVTHDDLVARFDASLGAGKLDEARTRDLPLVAALLPSERAALAARFDAAAERIARERLNLRNTFGARFWEQTAYTGGALDLARADGTVVEALRPKLQHTLESLADDIRGSKVPASLVAFAEKRGAELAASCRKSPVSASVAAAADRLVGVVARLTPLAEKLSSEETTAEGAVAAWRQARTVRPPAATADERAAIDRVLLDLSALVTKRLRAEATAAREGGRPATAAGLLLLVDGLERAPGDEKPGARAEARSLLEPLLPAIVPGLSSRSSPDALALLEPLYAGDKLLRARPAGLFLGVATGPRASFAERTRDLPRGTLEVSLGALDAHGLAVRETSELRKATYSAIEDVETREWTAWRRKLDAVNEKIRVRKASDPGTSSPGVYGVTIRSRNDAAIDQVGHDRSGNIVATRIGVGPLGATGADAFIQRWQNEQAGAVDMIDHELAEWLGEKRDLEFDEPAQTKRSQVTKVHAYSTSIQEWTGEARRKVAVRLGDEAVESQQERRLALRFARHAADEAHGVAAADEWRDRASIERAVKEHMDGSFADGLAHGLYSSLIRERRALHEATIAGTPGDQAREAAWLRWFFEPLGEGDGEALSPGEPVADLGLGPPPPWNLSPRGLSWRETASRELEEPVADPRVVALEGGFAVGAGGVGAGALTLLAPDGRFRALRAPASRSAERTALEAHVRAAPAPLALDRREPSNAPPIVFPSGRTLENPVGWGYGVHLPVSRRVVAGSDDLRPVWLKDGVLASPNRSFVFLLSGQVYELFVADETLAALDLGMKPEAVRSVAWSGDERTLLVVEEHRVVLADLVLAKKTVLLDVGPTLRVTDAAVSPDGRSVAVTVRDDRRAWVRVFVVD